jgi:hypothetical protein
MSKEVIQFLDACFPHAQVGIGKKNRSVCELGLFF